MAFKATGGYMGKILRLDLGQEQISEEWLGLAHLIPDLKEKKR